MKAIGMGVRGLWMFLALGLLMPGAAVSQVAIIEEVMGGAAGIARHQLLKEGQRIELPPSASITISYFSACRREVITGGKVTIGRDRSSLAGGTLQDEILKCATGLSGVSTAPVASGLAFRRGPGNGKVPPGVPEPAVTVFNTAPAFLIIEPGELLIERLDQTSTIRVFKAQGNLFDLQKQKVLLFAGGIYKATLNGREVIFRIAVDAQEGPGPLLSRLIRM